MKKRLKVGYPGTMMNDRIEAWVEQHAAVLQITAVGLASVPWLFVVFFGPMWLFGLPAFLIPAAAVFRWTTNPDPDKEASVADYE